MEQVMTPGRINACAACDVREAVGRPLEAWQEPGAAEVSEVVAGILDDPSHPEASINVERLKRAVYRLQVGSESGRTLILKRHKPAIAQTDRFLLERWLPVIGFADRCPRLVAAAANREGTWVWHIYEDLGTENLAVQRDSSRLAAAVDCIADLHVRAAGHAMLPEIRWRARDHGTHFFVESLRDAISALDRAPTEDPRAPTDFSPVRTRLRNRLSRLLADAPRQIRIGEALPETLLHGDLWPKNVFVTIAAGGARAQLIDWDHVGTGPFTYDLSTFLYQCSRDERPWILRRYREAVEHAGWRLPDDAQLNAIFYTAECARYAHCILWAAMALVNDGAEWGMRDLVDYDRWFETLRPPLPD
jgi:thiamine kinase-like enzyme